LIGTKNIDGKDPKSTVSLNYTFGRKKGNENYLYELGHFFELGGGRNLQNYIPFNHHKLEESDPVKYLFMIVVDLSKPGSAIDNL